MYFFFKQKTAFDMRISGWSSDVCSSDLAGDVLVPDGDRVGAAGLVRVAECATQRARGLVVVSHRGRTAARGDVVDADGRAAVAARRVAHAECAGALVACDVGRSEERSGGKECGSTCRYRGCAYQ